MNFIPGQKPNRRRVRRTVWCVLSIMGPSDRTLRCHTFSFSSDLTLSPLLKPHRACGPVSNLRTCVMNLGNHLQPCWYRIAHPVRTQTPSYPEVSIRLQAGNVGIPNKRLHH